MTDNFEQNNDQLFGSEPQTPQQPLEETPSFTFPKSEPEAPQPPQAEVPPTPQSFQQQPWQGRPQTPPQQPGQQPYQPGQ